MVHFSCKKKKSRVNKTTCSDQILKETMTSVTIPCQTRTLARQNQCTSHCFTTTKRCRNFLRLWKTRVKNQETASRELVRKRRESAPTTSSALTSSSWDQSWSISTRRTKLRELKSSMTCSTIRAQRSGGFTRSKKLKPSRKLPKIRIQRLEATPAAIWKRQWLSSRSGGPAR